MRVCENQTRPFKRGWLGLNDALAMNFRYHRWATLTVLRALP